MKVLSTCLPGYGHFNPMVPLARALASAGHEVAFATAEDFCGRVKEAGFQAFPAGLGMDDQIDQARRRFPETAAMPAGRDRFVAFVPRMLAGVAAPARLPELVRIVDQWRPDVLVHDVADFAGPVAAAVAGIPYADHSVGVLRPLEMARTASDILAPLHDEWRVDLGEFGGLFRYLYLDVCPPGLQSPEIGEIDVAHPMNNVNGLDTVHGDCLPAWVRRLAPQPTVYVTLGTVFNGDPRVFATILEGLRDEPMNVIVTTGDCDHLVALGPQPDNVRIERYIPLSLLLPHLDAVVTQAGTSILPVLGYGLPMLVMPQAADQFHHAAACVAAGAARRLLPPEVSPEAVRREVRTLLDEPPYRNQARCLQRQIHSMPGPEKAVCLLERLAREREPLPAAAPAEVKAWCETANGASADGGAVDRRRIEPRGKHFG